MLKAIVFDFDGVIVDTEPLHFRAFLEIADHIGVSFNYDMYLQVLIGYDDRDAIRVMLAMADGAGIDAKPQHFNGDPSLVMKLKDDKALAFERIVKQGDVATIAGSVELINEAAELMPIAISSGATKSDIDLILKAIDMEERFEVIVTADHVERSKPDTTSYTMAVSQLAQRHLELELRPCDCLAIEDTAAGIESARGAGLKTLALTTSGPAATLQRADAIVASLEHITVQVLRQWLEGSSQTRIT